MVLLVNYHCIYAYTFIRNDLDIQTETVDDDYNSSVNPYTYRWCKVKKSDISMFYTLSFFLYFIQMKINTGSLSFSNDINIIYDRYQKIGLPEGIAFLNKNFTIMSPSTLLGYDLPSMEFVNLNSSIESFDVETSSVANPNNGISEVEVKQFPGNFSMYLAYTSNYYEARSDEIYHFDISINWDKQLINTDDLFFKNSNFYDYYSIGTVFRHELGHAFGLMHSNIKAFLMSPHASQVTQLETVNINGHNVDVPNLSVKCEKNPDDDVLSGYYSIYRANYSLNKKGSWSLEGSWDIDYMNEWVLTPGLDANKATTNPNGEWNNYSAPGFCKFGSVKFYTDLDNKSITWEHGNPVDNDEVKSFNIYYKQNGYKKYICKNIPNDRNKFFYNLNKKTVGAKYYLEAIMHNGTIETIEFEE